MCMLQRGRSRTAVSDRREFSMGLFVGGPDTDDHAAFHSEQAATWRHYITFVPIHTHAQIHAPLIRARLHPRSELSGCAIDSACKHACMCAPECACMLAAPAISGGRTRRPANAVELELFQRRRQCDTHARTDCGAHYARARTHANTRAHRACKAHHMRRHTHACVWAHMCTDSVAEAIHSCAAASSRRPL